MKPVKRKLTPLRAASEIRASAKKQVKGHFDVFGAWFNGLAGQAEDLERQARILLATVQRAQRDLAIYREEEMQYFDKQRARQKAKKGGL